MDGNQKRELLMKHSQTPCNYRAGDDSYQTMRAYSDTCADDLLIALKIADDKIIDICFEGTACTIAKASTSIMSEALKHLSKTEALQYIDAYEAMLEGKAYDETLLHDEMIFQQAARVANRKQCAFMSWEAMRKLLK